MGAEDPSQRTLGLVSEEMPLGNGSSPVVVQDMGGMQRFRGLGVLNGTMICPTSVYVVVVSLTAERPDQRRQIKYW